MIFGNLYDLGTYPSLIIDIFRNLFFFIDTIIYSLIPFAYRTIFCLYDIRMLFTDNGEELSKLVINLSTIIYSFLAIVMFFRTAVSLLTMLIDPNKIDDKEQGIKKIVVNIFLCLALIVVVPKVFDIAKKLQTRIMEEHIIEKVVIGEDFGDNERYTLGNEVSISLWSVFLSPATDGTNSAVEAAYKSLFDNQDALGLGAIWPITKLYVVLNATSGLPVVSDILGKIFPTVNGAANVVGVGTHYQLSYVWLLSTIAGVYVLWAFVKMMIDVAYRSIKFFVLELLAPIAIISYIDPNSSKKGLFSKWLKETFGTYLSLFVRIFVFAIAAVLLRTFNLSNISGNAPLAGKMGSTLGAKLFYILAIVAFFKNAPKFLDDLFGTTMSKGSDTKFAHQMLGGLVAGGITATAGGISGGVIAGKTGKNVLKGVVSGAWSAGKKGYATGQKGGVGSMVGVIGDSFGAVADQKKKYGYEVDKDRERMIDAYEQQVEKIDSAKAAAVKGLEANNEAAYKALLEKGAKYNGRKYGKGLEDDARLKNTIKKNLGGLTRDEMLHKDDAEYLRLRRLVYEQKNGEALANRTLELAQADFERNTNAYQNSGNKASYIIDFAKETARMNAQQTADSKMKSYVNITVDAKKDLLVNEAGMNRVTVDNMSESELMKAYAQHLQNEATTNYNTAVNKVTQEVSIMNEAELDARFNIENAGRIETTYGNSFGDIAADAAKAKGDAEAAQKGLDDYLKTKGKGASYIDSIYALADTRHKAKVKEKERQQQQNSNNNNNNNGTNP